MHDGVVVLSVVYAWLFFVFFLSIFFLIEKSCDFPWFYYFLFWLLLFVVYSFYLVKKLNWLKYHHRNIMSSRFVWELYTFLFVDFFLKINLYYIFHNVIYFLGSLWYFDVKSTKGNEHEISVFRSFRFAFFYFYFFFQFAQTQRFLIGQRRRNGKKNQWDI